MQSFFAPPFSTRLKTTKNCMYWNWMASSSVEQSKRRSPYSRKQLVDGADVVVVIVSFNINRSSNWMRSNLILNFDSSQSNPFGKIHLHFKRILPWENENIRANENENREPNVVKNVYSNKKRNKDFDVKQKPLLLLHRIFRLLSCGWWNGKKRGTGAA